MTFPAAFPTLLLRGGAMKANKALRRLTKIETLMSDVAKRFSAHAPHLREAFADLKAALGRIKDEVGAGVSAATGKKKPAPGRKKAAKKAIVKAPTAKSAKKRAPITKVARSTAAKKRARITQKAATASAARESAPVSAEVE
jgi:hypothetical protein